MRIVIIPMQTLWIIADGKIYLNAFDNTRKRFLEIRRIQALSLKIFFAGVGVGFLLALVAAGLLSDERPGARAATTVAAGFGLLRGPFPRR